jgi:bifunctional non-homologous end joining protein LigD
MNKEVAINNHKLNLTNLDKLYWPEEKISKGDLINYYRTFAKYMLPYLKDRPESLNRHPNGIHGQSFFQKNVDHMPPSWVKTQKIYSDSNKAYINYMLCQNEATLIFMENPDFLALDLDPEDIGFESVIESALAVKEVLDEAGALGYIRTSGATGMHIYIPLKAKYNYDIAKEFARLIAQLANEKVPAITSLERMPVKRKRKVYLDFLQNRTGQTLAAPYSVRPRPGATVSAPLSWKEVKPGLDPRNFTMKNMLKRVEKIGEIFTPVLKKGIDINKCLKKLKY